MRLRGIIFTVMAAVATASISRVSLEHLQFYGLIVAIPFAAYAARLVYTLDK